MKKIFFAAILLFIFFPVLSFSQEGIRIHFINVGEGDALLIQAGDNNALVDTGNLLSGYGLVEYLEKNNVKKINYLIISHPHPDHIAGAFFILPKFQVDRVCDNGQALNEEDDMERWYKMLVRSGENYSVLKKGDKVKLGDVTLDILWPPDAETNAYNDNSLVIMLKYGKFRCLFTGDLSGDAENKLLASGPALRANILKVGHHGYRDATSSLFLDAVSPETAVISTGLSNRIGAPSEEVLNLLDTRQIKVYRTDRDDNIIIRLNKQNYYTIETRQEK